MRINAIKTLIFVVLMLPLLNLPPWFSPPDWGKTIVFRIIFSLLLFFFLWKVEIPKVLVQNKKRFVVFWLLLCLVALFFLATLFSVDRNFSLWGNPARGGGFVNFALLIIFAIIAFFVLKKQDWQRAWDVAILGCGTLVALLAIFQWQGWFSNFLVAKATRPMSTMGNDIQLGLYLVLLTFPAFIFALQQKNILKKIWYTSIFFLFLFVIVLTGSRGAYLGLALGFMYFILLFPLKKLWQSLTVKFLFLGIFLIPLGLVYYVNTHYDEVIARTKNNVLLQEVASRLYLSQLTQEPRFSTWEVGLQAIKARPLFGYGPENFEVGFDKFYDPILPNIQYIPSSSNSWWDRAHTFLVDNAAQAGIPALLVYLSIFGILLWQLQSIKNKDSEFSLQAHGIQATFIGYLTAIFFGFDTFSTYLVSFFLVAYALFIVRQNDEVQESQTSQSTTQPNKFKIPILACVAIALIFFNWQYNLKPLQVNKELVIGKDIATKQQCDLAMAHFEKAIKNSTFLNAYARAVYFDSLKNCSGDAQKGYDLMKEAAKLWPNHSRNWIFLGQLTNLLVEQRTRKQAISDQEKQQLLQEANSYFKKAQELTPKHQEIYIEWAKTYLLAGDYAGAMQNAKKCISLNPNTADCWWQKGLAQEYAGDPKTSERLLALAVAKGYNENTQASLNQLINVYIASKNYTKLVQAYEKLSALKPNDVQIHASLATAYKMTGLLQKAREEALKVLQLDPTTKAEVEQFLQSL